jgi:hypothetical protein
MELMAAANQFQLFQLKNLCESFACQGIDLENAADLLEAASFYGAPRLKSRCLQFMADNKTRLKKTY